MKFLAFDVSLVKLAADAYLPGSHRRRPGT
jgi:hypothetical protein